MTEDQPNTAFVYLYRDADNYKKWGRVVFEGRADPDAEERLRAVCFHSECFIAERVGIPTVFLYEEEDWERTESDHDWHEFWGLEPTDEEPDDEEGRTIGEFVEEFVTCFEDDQLGRPPGGFGA